MDTDMSNQHPDFAKLRGHVDGDDSFMNAWQPITLRTALRIVPGWMLKPEFLRDFLLRRFPRIAVDAEQRRRAGMWAFVINICFLRGETATACADYWNQWHDEHEHIDAAFVRRVIQKIRLAEAGRRLDGKTRSFGKPGRPKKSAGTPHTRAA